MRLELAGRPTGGSPCRRALRVAATALVPATTESAPSIVRTRPDGNNFTSGSAATPGECCSLCGYTPGCAAWTHMAHTNMCYMKVARSPAPPPTCLRAVVVASAWARRNSHVMGCKRNLHLRGGAGRHAGKLSRHDAVWLLYCGHASTCAGTAPAAEVACGGNYLYGYILCPWRAFTVRMKLPYSSTIAFVYRLPSDDQLVV